jgi:ATP phosphoribosyltransferase
MVVAGRKGDARLSESERRLGAVRIATKYPNVAERYFESTGRQAEVIEVNGSVELAPIAGLADGIVDLVASGRTLDENQLEVREEIAVCTARLVANRVAYKLRGAEIDALVERFRRGGEAV